jgi:hypothetical protein
MQNGYATQLPRISCGHTVDFSYDAAAAAAASQVLKIQRQKHGENTHRTGTSTTHTHPSVVVTLAGGERGIYIERENQIATRFLFRDISNQWSNKKVCIQATGLQGAATLGQKSSSDQ